ncbi:Protein SRG1 [Bienertia sinuspersici]
MEEKGEEVVNFGKSIIVPSVQELVKDSIANIPSIRYVRDHQDRLTDHSSLSSIPVIDLKKLLHDESMESELANLLLLAEEKFKLIKQSESYQKVV